MIFELDPLHSLIEFSARHLMISIIRGRFSEVHGTIKLDTQHPTKSWVKAQIQTNSIYTGASRRDAHLRSADFFNVSQYPTITFESQNVNLIDQTHSNLDGLLSLHGVTKSITFKSSYAGQCRDPLTDGWRIGLSALAIIDRRDFGMRFSRIEQGIALIGNEVRIEIHVEAIQSS